MIRVRQVKVSIYEKDKILFKISEKLKIDKNEISYYKIIKESIDARDKNNILFVYEVDVKLKNESILKKIYNKDIFLSPKEDYSFNPSGMDKIINRPVVVGFGPAGIFSSYMLSLYGYNPIIIERGKCVEERVKDVENFFETGVLNIESNVQFGEGGAGTFSDGKLNTMIKDKRFIGKKVFEILVENGAPEEILYKSKPHIGTDKLINVIKNIRSKMINMGATFMFSSKLTDIIIDKDELKEIVINDNTHIKTNVLILAIGHSARDTFYMLNKYLKLASKPFSVGVRVSHNQKMIDESQYGKEIDILGPASYKLTHTCENGRGVYTFCMCPGGYVINSSSEKGMLSINGMSNHNRDSGVANSAVIVTVTPEDFGSNPIDGIEFQRKLEEKAYKCGLGNIPIQLYKDYKNNIISKNIGSVLPLFKGSYTFSNINEILPEYINESIKEGMDSFDKKIKGFASDDVIIAAVESRTSSPVKIPRDDNFVSEIKGIYPCGEGAGYAGGITSAAIDGIKVSEAIMNKYKNK